MALPEFFENIEFPVKAILESYAEHGLVLEDGRTKDDGPGERSQTGPDSVTTEGHRGRGVSS